MPTLDRLERLTDLVLVLLHARHPVTLDEIAHEVPGYPEGREARRQAFERDKRLLREEGIPVVTEPVSGDQQYGYRIDPDSLYLADLKLAPDEQAALHLAVAGVHLGDPSGRNALLKLGAHGLADVRPVASLPPLPALVPLHDALQRRAVTTFTYRGESRRLAPWSLHFHHGRWYVVGWDYDREAGRTFRVDRMDDLPEALESGSAVLPEGVDPSTDVPEEPWRPGDGEAAEALVLVDPIEAWRVGEELGDGAVDHRRDDGSVVVRLQVTSEASARSWVLGLLDHAELLEPEDLRSSLVDWLRRTAEAGESAPVDEGGDAVGPAEDAEPSPTAGRAPRKVSPAHDPSARLRRLLAIVAWLAEVGHAPLGEVARRFELSEEEVVHELELAACCGLPPYSPDMLLEIEVTDEAVRAFLPADLARPRRLTAAEGFALAAAARTILAVPGADRQGALVRALAKLEAALGDHHRIVVDLDEPAFLEPVRRAAAEHLRLEIEYHSASRDETTVRVLDPFGVISLDGHWYLDAFCHRVGGTRRFRVDRIRALRELGPAPAAEQMHPRPEAFVPGPGAVTVELRVDPEALWVAETVPVLGVEPAADGSSVVRLAVGGTAWLARLLLQLGPHATVLGPGSLRPLAAETARRVLRRYQPGP